MKKLLITMTLLLSLMLYGVSVNAQDPPSKLKDTTSSAVVTEDYTIYWVTTVETVTVSWDVSEGASRYEVVVRWFRGDKILQVYAVGDTADTQLSFTLPRAGAFVAAVRAYGPDPENPGENLYSGWALSTDPTYALVNGQAKAWIIIGAVPAPGPPQ